MTVTELTAEFHALNQRYAKALDRGENTDSFLDEQARLSKAIIDTRSATVTELRQKFDLLLYWQEFGEGWIDDVDLKLTASIKEDFDRLTAAIARMIDDRDVWQAALLIVKRYGDDAMLEAAERADQLLDEDDRVAMAYQSAREVGYSLGRLCRHAGRSARAPVFEARRTRLSSIH